MSTDYLKPVYDALTEKKGWEHTGPVWEARPEYLEGAVSAVRESYGSIDAYLENGVGLTEQMRITLQSQLLCEPDAKK